MARTAWTQHTVLAAAALAALIQSHAASRPAAISIVSNTPCVAPVSQPAAQLGPAVGSYAAAAVAKCLPYELPATSAAVASFPSTRRLWAGLGVPEPVRQAGADLYGASVDAGAAARPLMIYSQPGSRMPAGLLSAGARAACTAISGALLLFIAMPVQA